MDNPYTSNNDYIPNTYKELLNYKNFCDVNDDPIDPNIYEKRISSIFLTLILFLFIMPDLYFLIKHLHTVFKENINCLFNDECTNEIENNSEIKNKEEIFVPLKPYEDKYLEEVKRLSYDIVFSESELRTETKQRDIIRCNMEDKLKKDKAQIENHLAYLDKILNKLENGEYDEDDKNDAENQETNEEKKEKKQQEIIKIQNEQKIFKKAQDLFEVKKIDDEEINKLAREFILKERLDNLKNCIVMEKTPIGNAIMFYNNEKSSFEYYSDSTLPYRYLEVIARKYILTYKCKQIFIDMEEEIKEAEKKLEEKKKKEEEEKQKEQEEKENGKLSTTTEKPSKNVFAKFKNYNKDNSIKVAAVPLDRPTTAKQTKPQEEKVIKERTNRYSFEGKLANFNFLKKIDRKVVDKRYAVSFSEFKKMQKTS
jgi:hypothetical protein